jgi:hypothetical protein
MYNDERSLPPLVGQVRQFSFTMTRKTRRPHPKRLQVRLPLSHATVLFGFPRQVSDRLRGLSLSTPPFSERNLNKRLCGAPRDGTGRLPALLEGRLCARRRHNPLRGHG